MSSLKKNMTPKTEKKNTDTKVFCLLYLEKFAVFPFNSLCSWYLL